MQQLKEKTATRIKLKRGAGEPILRFAGDIVPLLG